MEVEVVLEALAALAVVARTEEVQVAVKVVLLPEAVTVGMVPALSLVVVAVAHPEAVILAAPVVALQVSTEAALVEAPVVPIPKEANPTVVMGVAVQVITVVVEAAEARHRQELQPQVCQQAVVQDQDATERAVRALLPLSVLHPPAHQLQAVLHLRATELVVGPLLNQLQVDRHLPATARVVQALLLLSALRAHLNRLQAVLHLRATELVVGPLLNQLQVDRHLPATARVVQALLLLSVLQAHLNRLRVDLCLQDATDSTAEAPLCLSAQQAHQLRQPQADHRLLATAQVATLARRQLQADHHPQLATAQDAEVRQCP